MQGNLSKVRVLGGEISFVERGQGEAVVLVHGGLGDYRLWDGLSNSLSGKFRVISYSRRGFYPNEKTAGPCNVEQHSADLASLVSRLAERAVHVVGESYGALVATHFAIHNPEKVKTLVIDEPPILSLLSDDEEGRAELERFEREALGPFLGLFAKGRREEAARVLINYLEGSKQAYDSIPLEARDVILINSAPTYVDIKGGFECVTRQELGHAELRVLLLKSELGPKLLKRVVDILYDVLPLRFLEEIRGASHGTIVDSPDYFSSVLQFLSRSR
jgi:pimeloyl-ACP methyl ester carboxylesterase